MIRDTTAHRIASDWHGGQSSALYALSSSGAIDPERFAGDHYAGVGSEILAMLNVPNPWYGNAERKRLESLLLYVTTKGPRGPVDGWYENVIRKVYQ